MKCLSRTEIQEYLDKELEPKIMAEISDHLDKCGECSSTFKQAAADKILIGKLIGEGNSFNESAIIPEFVPPVLVRKKFHFYRLVPYLFAASLVGFILLFRTSKSPVTEPISEAEIMLYEFYDGKDLNKMWHEKSQIIILQDEKGNVIQSIITN